MSKSQASNFYPFYDPYRDSGGLGYGSKLGISLGFGIGYGLLQYYSLSDRTVFFSENLWTLALIISTSFFVLYVATDVFRSNLNAMRDIEGKYAVSLKDVDEWMSDKWLLLVGLASGVVNAIVGHLLGIPLVFFESSSSLVMAYFGFFLGGLASGMGLLAIIAVIVLYLKFALTLEYTLDPNDPDGNGGIKKLGDSLWFFGGLIGAVGVLVSIYMFGISWIFMHKRYVQFIFLFWVSLPYVLAVSVVLIPGLAVRRQVSYFKSYKSGQLKHEEMKLYSSYKQFESKEDEEIIAEKKELEEKLERIQSELETLKKMRNSHIDKKSSH